MTSEAHSVNGGGQISRLRRTLTLPLSKGKSRGRSFHTTQNLPRDQCDTKNDNKDNSVKKRPLRGNVLTQSMRTPLSRKHDIRVSRINPNHLRNATNEEINDPPHSSENSLVCANEEASDTSTSSGNQWTMKSKKKRPRYIRWPTQTFARVLDVSLKRPGSGRRNEHAAIVHRNVTVNRSQGDVLGIYIKEVKRANTNSAVHSSLPQSHVVISRLAPGSIAEKQGILKRGDEILSVNDRDIADMPLREVAASMDLHSQLVLSVRSKHINVNNNNVKVTSKSAGSEFQPTSKNTFSAPTITINRDLSTPVSQVPKALSSSETVRFPRDEAIPSVYDNNFSSTMVTTVPSPEERPPALTATHRIKMEYNEALSILQNAINSFETSRKTPSTPEKTEDYWSPLDEILSSRDSPSQTVPSLTENDNLSATSDSTSASLSTTPFFPSVSELPITDDPEYDDVAPSEFDEEEVRVDGSSRLYSPYRRSHSVSSSTSGSLHREDFLDGSSEQNLQQRGQDTIKLSDSSLHDTHNSGGFLPFSADQSQDGLHKNTRPGVTVRQRREWLDKGKKVSPELKIRIEGGPFQTEIRLEDTHADSAVKIPSQTQASDETNATLPVLVDGGRKSSDSSSAASACSPRIISSPSPSDSKTSPESDKSPMEKSPKSLFKISSNPESDDNVLQDQSSRRSPQPESQSTKKFWSIVSSPPSLKKIRKLPKLTKRKPGSTDWDSNDSSIDGSKANSSGIIERYNLEAGEVQNHRLSCQFLPHNRPHDPSIKPLNLSEFKKYKPPLPNAESGKYSQIPIEGSLVITLYGARYIKKTVSEVYCICQVDDDVKHRIRTRMQPCRGSVAWNECYEAKLEEAYDLHITLYTWESEGKHKLLAKSTLPVSDLLCVPQGVPVKLAVKLEPRGTFYVKLSLEDPSTLQGPKVFGADIQSILDREKSDLHIPLIVRDCIHEVELRGMSVVGIYRLCGSAIAKKELRKKYEHDSTAVDLSQENYPDVNVITGILKDFLRELPQPLFPPELLEAVTVAMENSTASSHVTTSVSSPFEPSPRIEFPNDSMKDEDLNTGRQSVILNILEVEKKVTLPPAEKATLYALLNHLKKVSANQEQNKMTCQNLAVCFGPVLLGSINMPTSKGGMDLTAAIGFKQHIQVLNFMVSNWPSKPVPLDSPEDVLVDQERTFDNTSEEGSRRASKRISRVSLTRRISCVFSSHNGSSSSSLSGCANYDGDSRNGGIIKPVLSNSRKSGSLTNILESNLDASEGACGDDGFFENQIEQEIFNDEDSVDEWDSAEIPFEIQFGERISLRKSSI